MFGEDIGGNVRKTINHKSLIDGWEICWILLCLMPAFYLCMVDLLLDGEG
jgi:hypothetical protein